MKGKKILGTILTGLLATTMFSGVALADKKPQKSEEFQQRIKLEVKGQKVVADIKIVKQQPKATEQTTKQIKVEVTKKVDVTKKVQVTKKAKKNYDLKKIKKDLWMFREAKLQMQKPVTYQQALTLTVRAMGYGSVNLSAYPVDNFKPKFKYADWAKNAVQVAVYNGLVTVDELNKYNPNKPITRTDLAVLLVKAKGIEVNDIAVLTVKDAAYIPTEKAPYVAAALKEGWFTAYQDNTFKPNKPVTRMIFASAFIKAGFDASAFLPKCYEVKGSLVDVDTANSALTVALKGAELPYAISKDVKVSVNGKAATLADLKAGMNVATKIENNVVVSIKASTAKVSETEENDAEENEEKTEAKSTSKKHK